MQNRIFFKISTLFALIIVVYVLVITFIISPKIINYLKNLEIKQAVTQLNRISSVIDEREEYLKEYKKERIREYKKQIKETATIAYNITDKFYNLYKQKKLTKKEALKNIFALISKIEYGYEDDYFFVLNTKGDLLYHPDKRFASKNVYEIKDIKGKAFIKEIISKTTLHKEAYSEYFWTKLNSNQVSQKILYSVYFKPFDLIINAGGYVESIKQDIEAEKTKVIFKLAPLIKSISDEQMGFIYVVNSLGKIVLHPDEKLLNTDLSLIKQPNKNESMMTELIKSYKDGKVWRYKWNKNINSQNFNYDKLSWIKYNKFFDWYILSSVYEDKLNARADEVNDMIINTSLLILVFFTIIAIILTRKLLMPISALSRNADLVKEGRLDIRNDISSNDEFGHLALHFNSMLDSIEQNTKNLESILEQRTAQLEYKFYHDELTGLKNRLSLMKDLNNLEFHALNLIDINGFDEINEFYGFEVGNSVLLKVSKVLDKFAKQNDLELYKLDFDVFALLDINISSFVVYEEFLKKILSVFDKEFYIEELKIQIHLYVTVGTSISQEEPVKTANIALKKAKKEGVPYIAYSKDIDTKENVRNYMYFRDKIKHAIEEDEVVPFIQPIFDKNSKIVKYETLMRIKDKEKYLLPGQFLDISIKTGQYFKLNQIVIRKVLEKIELIKEELSINISFNEINNANFRIFIDKQISRLKKEDREKIVFEILESDFISDYKLLDEFIQKHREMGVKIAIDDFGTGYSNFEEILKMKPDFIKIDGSLIKNIVEDENSYKLVKSIIEFSKHLGMEVIAEYVCSKEIFDILQSLDVDEYQGFYLGEPKPLI